ncbi:MAG: xanthine dehydrogenase family protein molybdopterin-binding subunit, partial [Kiloniellales bacterium]|nr:xanthine dehydrogenase family protein molybdopterin-binding subunit [Kiloniellales bacterium]
MAESNIVGIPTPRVEGHDKVSGRAAYAADVKVPGVVWVKVVRSPLAHARIKRIDTSKAGKVGGVKAVVTGEDFKGVKIGKKIVDMPVLADGVVRYLGEKVAAVAAETEAIAEQAAGLIEVEYEELESVLDPVEAARSEAPLIHPDVMTYKGLLHEMEQPSNVFVRLKWEKGNCDEAFKQADLVVENTFTTSLVHQAYIEPHCCIVKAVGKDGAEVWASSKSPFALREHLGQAVGIPPANVIVHLAYIGGDFGGKGDANDIVLCYELSKRTGSPVKFQMDYTEELVAGNPRHSAVIRVRTGVKKNGLIVAQYMNLLFDSGAYGSYRPQGFLVGAHSAAGPYRIPNLLMDEQYVYTNKIPCGYMRAPGFPQGFFASESQMDLVAKELRMDPAKFRAMNFMHDGDEDPTGLRITHIKTEETLKDALNASGFQSAKEENVGRGFAVGHWVSKGGESYIHITLGEDGGVTLAAALADVGPGAYTIMRQIVAEELKVPIDSVAVESVDTTQVLKDTGVRGSSSTRVHGNAAYDGVEKVRTEVLKTAARHMGVPEAELNIVNGGVTHTKSERRMTFAELVKANGVPIASLGHYANPQDGPEASTVAQVAEVQVDPETGEIRLRQLTISHHIGTILNPLSHQGQIDGGVVMGMGAARMEEIRTE